MIRRLQRLKRVAAENAAREDGTGEPAETNEDDTRQADFSEGLSRILSGMCANLSKAVCSSVMGHLTVSNNGSRFQYSHEFTNFLVGQMLDVLDGLPGHFRIRTNYSKKEKKKIFWADSMVDDYLHRPDGLEGLCMYEFLSCYEKVCKTFKQLNKKAKDEESERDVVESDIDDGLEEDAVEEEDENDESDCDSEVGQDHNQYYFKDGHPGREFAFLRKRKHQVVPVISVPEGSICSIEDLEMSLEFPQLTQ